MSGLIPSGFKRFSFPKERERKEKEKRKRKGNYFGEYPRFQKVSGFFQHSGDEKTKGKDCWIPLVIGIVCV